MSMKGVDKATSKTQAVGIPHLLIFFPCCKLGQEKILSQFYATFVPKKCISELKFYWVISEEDEKGVSRCPCKQSRVIMWQWGTDVIIKVWRFVTKTMWETNNTKAHMWKHKQVVEGFQSWSENEHLLVYKTFCLDAGHSKHLHTHNPIPHPSRFPPQTHKSATSSCSIFLNLP